MQMPEVEKEIKEQKKFSKINDRHQTTYPRSSKNIKQDKYPKITPLNMSSSNCRNQSKKENVVRR